MSALSPHVEPQSMAAGYLIDWMLPTRPVDDLHAGYYAIDNFTKPFPVWGRALSGLVWTTALGVHNKLPSRGALGRYYIAGTFL